MAYPVARKLTRMSGSFGPREPIPLGGGRFSPSFHGGVDFTPLEKGSRIPTYAVGAGVVYGINLGGGAAGNNVMIRLDGDGSFWWYGHLSRVDVRKGQRVRDGQQIGLIGATGNTTGVHLHLERHWPRLDIETDPWPYIVDARDIDGNTSSWQTGTPTVAVGDTNTAAPAKTAEQYEEDELMGAKDEIFAKIDQAMEIIRRESRPRLYERTSTKELLLARVDTGFIRGPWKDERAMRDSLPVNGEHLVNGQEYERRLKVSDEDWAQLLAEFNN